jgi:hypothetical protein
VNSDELLTKLLIAGCIYEVVSLTTRRVPTITALVKRLHHYRWGRILVWAWCGYISWHFLEPGQS